jgi:hypothetical protein
VRVHTHAQLTAGLRFIKKFSGRYSVACDCMADQKIRTEDCAGLRVFNEEWKQIAAYRGRGYSAVENPDGSVSIFSEPSYSAAMPIGELLYA